MRLYLRAELVAFLASVDRALQHRVEVVIIGGAAAAIQYGFAGGTRDIDTWTTVQRELAVAVKRAHEATGLAVPFEKSGTADGPYELESRLRRTLSRLRRLRVLVPEKHDLVLMKMVRGYEHDLEAIEAIHRRFPLRLETLLTRYEDEMGAVVISPLRLKGNLLTMIERLFPNQLDAVIERIAGRVRRPSRKTRDSGAR